MACGRGFKSPQLHQYKRPTGSPVGLFFSVAACLRGFPWVLADFTNAVSALQIAISCSLGGICLFGPSRTRGSKSANVVTHSQINQGLTGKRIKWLILGIGWGRESKALVLEDPLQTDSGPFSSIGRRQLPTQADVIQSVKAGTACATPAA